MDNNILISSRMRYTLTLIALVSFIVCIVLPFGTIRQCLIALSIPVWMYGLWLMTPATPWPRILVGSSFVIFASHQMVISLLWCVPISRTSLSFNPTECNTVAYIFWWLVITGFCLIISWLIRKSKIAEQVFLGGR